MTRVRGPRDVRDRRWGIVIAAVLLIGTPVMASARLRAALRDTPLAHLTSQPGQAQREVAAVDVILQQLRGTNAVACEMAMVAVDHNNWFGDWGDNGNSPLLEDAQRPQLPHRLESENVVDPLMTALRDPDYCVRRAAASLLGRSKTTRAAERLRTALDDTRPEMRALAAFALGSAEEQSAGPKLQQLLRDSVPTVRTAAAWSLGQLEYRPALNALVELLERDQSPRVRRAAARSLGQLGS